MMRDDYDDADDENTIKKTIQNAEMTNAEM